MITRNHVIGYVVLAISVTLIALAIARQVSLLSNLDHDGSTIQRLDRIETKLDELLRRDKER